MAWPHYPFVEATYDRANNFYRIQQGLSAGTTAYLAYPSRTNYQKVSLFSNLQSLIHQLADGISTGHFVQNKLYDGATTIDNLTWAYCVANAPLAQGDWTRKYYREVVDNTSTVEVYGSANGGTPQAVANGQRAYRRSDKQIVDRVGGVWVPNYTAREPDIITTGGYFSEGDLIGDWLLNEVNDVMDLFGALKVTSGWNTTPVESHNVSPGTETTVAAIKASCEAAYAADTGSGGAFYPYAVSRLTYDGSAYGGVLERCVMTSTYSPVSTVASCTADFYGVGDYAPSSTTFGDEGDPVLYGQFKRFSAGVSPSGTSVTSGNMGATNDAPVHPWCATPTLATTPTSLGYKLGTTVTIILKYAITRPT